MVSVSLMNESLKIKHVTLKIIHRTQVNTIAPSMIFQGLFSWYFLNFYKASKSFETSIRIHTMKKQRV